MASPSSNRGRNHRADFQRIPRRPRPKATQEMLEQELWDIGEFARMAGDFKHWLQALELFDRATGLNLLVKKTEVKHTKSTPIDASNPQQAIMLLIGFIRKAFPGASSAELKQLLEKSIPAIAGARVIELRPELSAGQEIEVVTQEGS